MHIVNNSPECVDIWETNINAAQVKFNLRAKSQDIAILYSTIVNNLTICIYIFLFTKNLSPVQLLPSTLTKDPSDTSRTRLNFSYIETVVKNKSLNPLAKLQWQP